MGSHLSLDKELEKQGFFMEDGEMRLQTNLSDSSFPKQLTNTWDLYILFEVRGYSFHRIFYPTKIKNNISIKDYHINLIFAKRDGDIWMQSIDKIKKLRLNKPVKIPIYFNKKTIFLKTTLKILISKKN